MACDVEPLMRATAAYNPNVEYVTLLLLLMDTDVSVRRAAVKNPKMNGNLYAVAMTDTDMGVRAYAKMRLEEI